MKKTKLRLNEAASPLIIGHKRPFQLLSGEVNELLGDTWRSKY